MRDLRREGEGGAEAGAGAGGGAPGRRTRSESLPAGQGEAGGLRDPLPPWDGPPLGGGDDPFGLHLENEAAAPAAAVAAAGEPQLVAPQGTAWPVFAASGKPYVVESRDGRPGAWVVRDWIMAAPDVASRGGAWVAPSRARELLEAVGGFDPARLELAAENLTFSFTKPYEYLRIGAQAMHATGLPVGKSAVVERAPASGLHATVALDDPTIAPGTPHELTTSELMRAVDAVAAFTGLSPAADGIAFMTTRWARPSLAAGNGVVTIELSRGAGRTLFGLEAYDEWAGGPAVKSAPPADPATPKLKLQNFYQGPVPGQLTHYADLVESGESVRLEVLVDWPHHFPDAEVYAAPPMVTPSKFGNVALLQCSWQFERVPGFIGRVLRDAAPGAMDAGGAAQSTTTGEAFHRFQLAPGETEATFRVTCEARFDEYFEPTTFTRDVVVTSSAAALGKLQSEAFTGLGAPDTARQGGAWTGDVAPDFTPTPAADRGGAVADPKARDREAQRDRLEAVGDYLRDNPASADAVAAIDGELARQHRTEELLAGDQARGWQAFQLRGTYLSRTEGLASGPLDLHGTVRVEMHHDVYPGDGPSTVQRIRNDKYVVQIRDLSRRFEQTDFAFEGTADTFHDALSAAFYDLAIAYPKGLVSIEAEDIRGEALRQPDGGPGPQAALGPSTGKVLGFQRSTDTTWKQVKATVWDPVAQVAVNLGAIALMTLVPGSAAIVAPALIAYNSVPPADHIASQAARGTLTAGTFAMSAGEIALNLLPMVSSARPFTAGWIAVETANWGGQVALMGAAAVGMAHELQAQHVAALAEEYQAFLELQERSLPSDPDLAIAEARIRDRAAAVDGMISEQFLALVRDNALQMVAGSVIHNSSAHVREAIVEHLQGRAAHTASPDAAAAAGGPVHPGASAPPPPDPIPHDGVDDVTPGRAHVPPIAARATDDPTASPAHVADVDDPWARAARQHDALDAARGGAPDRAQRDVLIAELERQVSTLGLAIAVAEGRATTVVTLVVPGGGPLGIKTLNDDLVGYAINSTVIGPQRNALFETAFGHHGLSVVAQNYKSTTLVSTRPTDELGSSIRVAVAEIDVGMRPILERGLRAGIDAWERERKRATPGSPDHASATRRIEKMRALLPRVHDPDFEFDFHVGAADISGGKDASYDQILAAEMNATKGAIMARDPELARSADTDLGESRAFAYDEAEFITFARETVAIRDQLEGRTLPWHDEARAVVRNDRIDHDLLRALRKGKLDTSTYTAADRETLALLQQYFTRVNVFDYMKHFEGSKLDSVAATVDGASRLVQELKSDRPISRETLEQLEGMLRGGVPQAGTASEARFYQRAAKLGERVILNADIKDLGLTLFDGYAETMERVGRSAKPDVATASRTASDKIVVFKNRAVKDFVRFYQSEMLPSALAKLHEQGRSADAEALKYETEPLMLLGGDEITVSLHPLFDELELTPRAVAKLMDAKGANARVAVTGTSGAADGAAGHAGAMAAAEPGHDLLKKYEQLARDLDDKAKRLPPALADQADEVAVALGSLYTERSQIRGVDGEVANVSYLEARADALLKHGEIDHD